MGKIQLEFRKDNALALMMIDWKESIMRLEMCSRGNSGY